MLYFDKYHISVMMNLFNFHWSKCLLCQGGVMMTPMLNAAGDAAICRYIVTSMYLVLVDRRLDPVPHALDGAPK